MRILAVAPAFLAICTGLIASPAAPAEFTRRGTVIYITGEIGRDDYFDFMQVRGDLRRGSIVLNSLGGYLMTAMLIGGNIHDRQFETVVRSGDVCSSVCTMIWLAGKPRYLGRLAKLGFHSASYPDRPGARNEEGNRLFADYFTRIGAPQQIIDLQPMADPCCLNYVDYMQAKVWGLLKEQPTKQELHQVANRKTVWLKPSPWAPAFRTPTTGPVQYDPKVGLVPANPDGTPDNTDPPTVPPQVLKAASLYDNFALNAVGKTAAEVAGVLDAMKLPFAPAGDLVNRFMIAAKGIGLAPEARLTSEVLSDPDKARPLAKSVGIGAGLSDEQWQQAHAIALQTSRKRQAEKASASQPPATRHCGLAIQKPCEDVLVSEEDEAP